MSLQTHISISHVHVHSFSTWCIVSLVYSNERPGEKRNLPKKRQNLCALSYTHTCRLGVTHNLPVHTAGTIIRIVVHDSSSKASGPKEPDNPSTVTVPTEGSSSGVTEHLHPHPCPDYPQWLTPQPPLRLVIRSDRAPHPLPARIIHSDWPYDLHWEFHLVGVTDQLIISNSSKGQASIIRHRKIK